MPSSDLYGMLVGSDQVGAANLLQTSWEDSSSFEVIENLIVPTLSRIGEEWSAGKLSLSQVYISGRIVEKLVQDFFPKAELQRKDQPTLALVILEDYHALGKRIVYSILRSSGYEVQDYGTMNAEELAERAIADNIDVLLISTLMYSSARRVKRVRELLKQNNSDMKIVVGGAPFNFDRDLWKDVGANTMNETATDLIKTLAEWETL